MLMFYHLRYCSLELGAFFIILWLHMNISIHGKWYCVCILNLYINDTVSFFRNLDILIDEFSPFTFIVMPNELFF